MVNEMESVIKNTTSNNPVNSDNAAYMGNAVNSPQQPVQHSPDSVGLEFVRQYYTVLNRAPELLFRFYSDDSTLIHGCLDDPGERVQQPVTGQKQIKSKILSLNFENCHTKIRQMDSMETIGNGVVIQVIGELSNNGQPLRRFCQTFVLTLQSPNKYYVRNDIFRYQDDEALESHVEKAETESKMEIIPQAVDSPVVNEKEFSHKSNGNADEEEPISVPEKLAEEVKPAKVVPEAKIESKPEQEPAEGPNEEECLKISVSPLVNEPKTYAGILGRGSQGTAPVVPTKPIATVTTASIVENPVFAENPAAPSVVPAAVPKPPFVNTSQQRNENRFQKKPNNRRTDSRESAKNNDSDSGDGGEHPNAASKKYSDDNQLFIGNLLPNFIEEDLLNIFGKYGKILEVKIHRQNKVVNGKGRNYGFITYERAEVVDEVLAQKPIFHDNHRYNVERKQGKSNYGRERNPPNSNNLRNPNLPNSISNVHHMQGNMSGGGGPGQGPNVSGGARSRVGGYQSSNHPANNGNNRNYNSNIQNNSGGGQTFSNRNQANQQHQMFNPQQNR